MNERIQLLARTAGATDQKGGRAENIFCFTTNELDGFAQLIVKECISYIDSRDYYSGSEGIAEHFGVYND